jgi:hypothetical protein
MEREREKERKREREKERRKEAVRTSVTPPRQKQVASAFVATNKNGLLKIKTLGKMYRARVPLCRT